MFSSTRSRLSLSYLIVLLIGMGLAGGLSWLAVEELYLNTQRENLLAQARLTASALQGAPLPVEPAEAYMQTANIAPGIHTRMLGDQGAVLVGLPLSTGVDAVPVPSAENRGFVRPEDLIKRPEIQSALAGQAETAVRRVLSAEGNRVLYAAAPVWREDQVIGIAYLATPLPPTGLPTNLMIQLFGAVLAAVILAGIAGTILSASITRPLECLDRAASAVSAGDLDQYVPTSSRIRELDNLGQAFNAMTASLRQADQAKNAFIADVTHELRTPLTVIKGTVETLEDGALDDLQGRGALLDSMHQEANRLIRLVNDLLVLTRADAGTLNLDIRPLDLLELARARCETLAPLGAKRQLMLKVVPTGSDSQARYTVLGDIDRLMQVYDNILDNAIRHAYPGTSITVKIGRSGDEIQSMVQDRGPGIPPEHLPFIFERFYRVSSSRNRQSGGSGLGLAIVRSLVQAQGGRIGAESSKNRGTIITFWLPAAKTDTELPHG
jgi:signal transduction histidine kinase